MRKLTNFTGKAEKIQGHDNIEYCLWFDKDGEAYVQMINNENSGTYSSLLFSVSKYAALKDKNKKINIVEGNGAFIKAILRSFLPSGEK
jgi:hypothetical protein